MERFDIEDKLRLRREKNCSEYKERYKLNPRKYKKRIYDIRYRSWGSSLKEKHSIWKEQGRICAICGKKIPMLEAAFDHDHSTNKVRGVLCNSCNKGLGCFMDDKGTLFNAILYLNKFDTLTRNG